MATRKSSTVTDRPRHSITHSSAPVALVVTGVPPLGPVTEVWTGAVTGLGGTPQKGHGPRG